MVSSECSCNNLPGDEWNKNSLSWQAWQRPHTLNSSSAVIDLKAPISTTPLHSMHLSPGPKHGMTWQLSNLLLSDCSSAGIAWTVALFGASGSWKVSGAGAARASSNCTIKGDNVIGGDHGGNGSRFGRRCNQASSFALVWKQRKNYWVIKYDFF